MYMQTLLLCSKTHNHDKLLDKNLSLAALKTIHRDCGAAKYTQRYTRPFAPR